MNELDLRQQIVATALEMNAVGLNRGSSGNISVRWGNGFLITPTGLSCTETSPADIVPMNFDGSWIGSRAPSSEWHFHQAILSARPEIGSVLHAHSPFATTLACLGLEIPPFHYMIAVAGGKTIRCAPYATFGTQKLSDHALTALEGRKACLLANHGMIVLGTTLADSLARMVEVEALCEQYWRALQVAVPNLLSDAEMDLVLEKFKTYGQSQK